MNWFYKPAIRLATLATATMVVTAFAAPPADAATKKQRHYVHTTKGNTSLSFD